VPHLKFFTAAAANCYKREISKGFDNITFAYKLPKMGHLGNVGTLVMTAAIKQVFTDEHVSLLTGLSKWQLRTWDKLGFFVPRFAHEDRFSPFSRIYSFKDVVGLRTIAVLMKEYHVSLHELQRVATELIKRGYSHWAELKLYVVKKQVHFRRPGSQDVEGVWDGQLAMLNIIDVIADVEKRVENLRKRKDDQRGRIEQHKYVVRNAPVIAGTRIPTAAIRRFHEAGYSVEQIIRQYPTLSEEDIKAALAFEEGLAKTA
jgi:uncharacterized protein (DUF433 family)